MLIVDTLTATLGVFKISYIEDKLGTVARFSMRLLFILTAVSFGLSVDIELSDLG